MAGLHHWLAAVSRLTAEQVAGQIAGIIAPSLRSGPTPGSLVSGGRSRARHALPVRSPRVLMNKVPRRLAIAGLVCSCRSAPAVPAVAEPVVHYLGGNRNGGPV